MRFSTNNAQRYQCEVCSCKTTIADEPGLRSMDYRYQNQDYYMRYKPAATANCYDFETRTVTDNGEIKSGEYCR